MNKELGHDIPKLGFGLMRLPTVNNDPQNGEVDIPKLSAMVDRFMESGFTYFDTAYVYGAGKSEMAARDALLRRYPRGSFQLADKLPLWSADRYDDLQKLFDTSLERTEAGYFDYYLLHALDTDNYAKSEQLDAWRFVKEMKEQGKALHIGFSFHDSPELLDEILTKHPEAEFVQLQINYADWENDIVHARRCFETARKHCKPVIVMEPVKGGSLAEMRPEVEQYFLGANPEVSVASWAIRYALSLPGIITVLSGMSAMNQMEDNITIVKGFTPLSDSERAVIAKVVDELAAIPTVPCTACRYCVDDCPQKINIPELIRIYNDYIIYQNSSESKKFYGFAMADSAKASSCIACGSCESHCPQHIKIIETMALTAENLE